MKYPNLSDSLILPPVNNIYIYASYRTQSYEAYKKAGKNEELIGQLSFDDFAGNPNEKEIIDKWLHDVGYISGKEAKIQDTLFDIEPEVTQPRILDRNPMVNKHGKTEGKKCKTCDNLIYHERNKRWYKCTLRGITCGRGTDHGCTWNACGLYKEQEGE